MVLETVQGAIDCGSRYSKLLGDGKSSESRLLESLDSTRLLDVQGVIVFEQTRKEARMHRFYTISSLGVYMDWLDTLSVASNRL